MKTPPLYYRIFLSLRDQILNGEYDWQEPMPAETKLAKEFSTTRPTIRKALALLEEEGLVVRSQGSRTYARALGYSAAEKRQNLIGAAKPGSGGIFLSGDVAQLYSIIKCTKELARQFTNEKQLGRVARVREEKGRPYCFIVTYLPLHIADKIDWESVGSKPILTVAGDAGFDFVKAEQVITATVANDEMAAALNVPLGSALLRVSGLFIDASGAPIMRKDGYFHPDSFEYRSTIYNNQAN